MSVTIIKNLYKSRGFEPFIKNFVYTGGVQTLLIPERALYQLEVWGSKGGHSYGGNGGYSKGYALLKKDTLLYICCGGVPYNGGSNGDNGGDGGGATHIALVDGILRNIGLTSFVTNQNGFIVAGGGGGGANVWYGGGSYGGVGGGLTGGNGMQVEHGTYGTGGTQNGAGSTYNSSPRGLGGFGYGGPKTGESSWRGYIGGAGGGFYGGGGAYLAEDTVGSVTGGGGSGWIDGTLPEITYKNNVYAASTESGVNSGTGKAKITKIDIDPSHLILPHNMPTFNTSEWVASRGDYTDGWVSNKSTSQVIELAVESYGRCRGYMTSPVINIDLVRTITLNLSKYRGGNGFVDTQVTVQASIDGTNWDTINSYSSGQQWGAAEYWDGFTIVSNVTKYKYYKIVCFIDAYHSGDNNMYGAVRVNSIVFS